MRCKQEDAKTMNNQYPDTIRLDALTRYGKPFRHSER